MRISAAGWLNYQNFVRISTYPFSLAAILPWHGWDENTAVIVF